ncbi:transcriptional repressor [Acidovorax sacchari]|uniref:transcriptional repressor n=1 Tax=Acidovorax sacchari TaxID=3230736 RepID=UPI0039E3FB71
MRPTIARAGVLNVLDKAAPGCLDANHMYRVLCRQFDNLTPGAIYKALNDLWNAGLLLRTEGARGRALYALKPEALSAVHVTLRCQCGARLVFIEDLMLREHLESVTCEEGFALGEEPVFTITTTCAKCRQRPREAREAVPGPVTAGLRRKA